MDWPEVVRYYFVTFGWPGLILLGGAGAGFVVVAVMKFRESRNGPSPAERAAQALGEIATTMHEQTARHSQHTLALARLLETSAGQTALLVSIKEQIDRAVTQREKTDEHVLRVLERLSGG